MCPDASTHTYNRGMIHNTMISKIKFSVSFIMEIVFSENQHTRFEPILKQFAKQKCGYYINYPWQKIN